MLLCYYTYVDPFRRAPGPGQRDGEIEKKKNTNKKNTHISRIYNTTRSTGPIYRNTIVETTFRKHEKNIEKNYWKQEVIMLERIM